MTDAFDATLGRAWTDDAPWEVLSSLTALGDRMAGHTGEHAAADIVANAFRDADVRDVQVESFPMERWTRGTTELAVTAPVERSFPAIALPYSPPGDMSGQLVDVGYGTPDEIAAADLEGAIALCSATTPSGERFVHRIESYGLCVDAGAVGFVFANHVPGELPPTGSLRFGSEARVPGIGVSHETGSWLAEYADGTATMHVDAETAPGTSRNVHGILGPATDDEIVLVAHHDAHDIAEGALDNACGVAVVVGAVRILSSLELDRRVRVATVGSEEIGLLGSTALASELDLDAVHAVVNVDGAGRFRDLRAFTHTSDTIEAVVTETLSTVDQPVSMKREPHPYSDHWPFLQAGVPSLQLHAESGERGRGWGHTAADTRDKVDARNLREHAMLAALLVQAVASADVPRIDLDALKDAMHDEDLAPGMRAAEIWPAEW